MGVSVPGAATNILIPGRKASTVSALGGGSSSPTANSSMYNKKFRKGSMIDQNGLMYKKTTTAVAARRG